MGGVVYADTNKALNGYYTYNFTTSEWDFARPLSDTLAGLSVVSIDDNEISALASPGVNPAGVKAFYLDLDDWENTGPVTIRIDGAAAIPVVDVTGGEFLPGVATGRLFLSNEGSSLRMIVGGDFMAAVTAAIDAAIRAEAAAASLSLPTIQPGDERKQLYVKSDLSGYELDKPARGGGELFKTIPDMLADDNEVIGYEGSGAEVEVAAGYRFQAGGFWYEIAPSGASDNHLTTAGGLKLYVIATHGQYCASAFGVAGNGSANDTARMQRAVDATSTSFAASRLLIDKLGTYLLDQLILKTKCILVGADRDGVVLKYSGAALTPIPAYPGIAVAVQLYKAFLRTSTAGQNGQWTEGTGVENLTIDWSNAPAGGNAGTLLWLGNARNAEAKRLRFINCLPSDYNIVSSAGRGAALFMSYVEGGIVEGCKFTDAASYEELGIRYHNKDITVRKNHFAGKGPWRHNIEVAAVRDLSGILAWPKGILIEDNLLELHGSKQDVLSSHDGGDVVFRNNRVVVMSDLVDTSQSGFRSLVKRFDNEDGVVEGSLLVDGNSFDFRTVPGSVKRAFECVRIWAGNVTVVNNLFRGRTDGFDNSLQDTGFYPWVGAGDNHYNPRNVIVANNQFELYEYSANYTFQVIKMTGNGVAAFGNTLNVKVPTAVTTNGPVFIDLHGANAGAGDNPPADGLGGGKATSVIGNTSFSTAPNAILTHINMRGNTGQAQYVAMGNPSNCAVSLLGTSPYLSQTTGDEMRVAIGNIGAGIGAQQYRYHTFTWNPASINAGTQTSVDVPIAGVTAGDDVSASFSLDLQFCTLTAYVYSAGNVRVVLTNTSASAKDLASGTVTLRVKNRL